MKFEAAKYFLILLTIAVFSYYGTMMMTSNRVESNLGKDFEILNEKLIETHFSPQSQLNIVFKFHC